MTPFEWAQTMRMMRRQLIVDFDKLRDPSLSAAEKDAIARRSNARIERLAELQAIGGSLEGGS